MSFGGPPVKTETSEEEDELVRHDENESKIGRFYSLRISFPSFLLVNDILLLPFLQKQKCSQLLQSWCTANLFYGNLLNVLVDRYCCWP